jgi:hypothetical protein
MEDRGNNSDRPRAFARTPDIRSRLASGNAGRLAYPAQPAKPQPAPQTPAKDTQNPWKRFLNAKAKKTQPAAPAKSQTPESAVQRKEIAVTITMPKVKLPKLKLSAIRIPKERLPKVTRRTAAIGIAAVVAVAAPVIAYMSQNNEPKKTASNNGAAQADVMGAAQKGTPDYNTLLPAGKDIEQLGGWARVSPPDRDAVYAFVDELSGVQLNVTEQPLPANFAKDVETEVAKLAKQFSANDQLSTDGAITYIGVSRNGPQSVIVAKDDVLILIKSASRIPDEDWIKYINSFQ